MIRPIEFVRRTTVCIAMLLGALMVGRTANAQTTTCNTGNGTGAACALSFTMAMTVNKTVRLEASSSSLALVSGDASAADYAAGFKTAGTLTVTARANTGVVVTMAAATTNFSYSGSASPAPTKAASTLQYSTDGFATSGIAVTTSGGPIIPSTGTLNAGATSGTSKTVSFRTGLQWAADPPGTYTLTLNLTITAP